MKSKTYLSPNLRDFLPKSELKQTEDVVRAGIVPKFEDARIGFRSLPPLVPPLLGY